MNYITSALQIIVSLGLINVWLLRFSKNTKYRGGSAKNLSEEFAAYGLPTWFMYFIGLLKLGSALALLIGLWVPALVQPTAYLVVALMAGALVMHAKIRDPLVKSLPAALVLVLSLAIILTSRN